MPFEWHLNGISLASRWCPNIECWLGSFVIFLGCGPVLLRKHISIFLWIFRGLWTPPPPLDPPMRQYPWDNDKIGTRLLHLIGILRIGALTPVGCFLLYTVLKKWLFYIMALVSFCNFYAPNFQKVWAYRFWLVPTCMCACIHLSIQKYVNFWF